MRKPDELRLYAALRERRGPIPWRIVEAAAVSVGCNVKRARALFLKWDRRNWIVPLTGGGMWSTTAPKILQALAVDDTCDAEDWDKALQPCGRALCMHGRCHMHGGCEQCNGDDRVDASAIAFRSLMGLPDVGPYAVDPDGPATRWGPGLAERLEPVLQAFDDGQVRLPDIGISATLDRFNERVAAACGLPVELIDPSRRVDLPRVVAEEAALRSRVYGEASIGSDKGTDDRTTVMVMGVTPSGERMQAILEAGRRARVISGARVVVLVDGHPIRFFEGFDLSQMAERRLPPLDFVDKREPIRITLTQTLPGRIDRIAAKVSMDGPPLKRQSVGYRPDPLQYADGHRRTWCNPPTRPTTIESPIPRPVVVPPFGLVVHRAGMQGKGTPKGVGQGKGAYRHGVGSRRDVRRLAHQRRVRRAVARYMAGVPFAQL